MKSVAMFTLRLHEDGRKLSLSLERTQTWRRGRGNAKIEGDHGTFAVGTLHNKGVTHRYEREEKRVAAVHKAFARLLENLNVDLGDCYCAPGDTCPAHALLKALGGSK